MTRKDRQANPSGVRPAYEILQAGPPMKIALFLPNWIGDVVMATPALRAIRRRFPDAELIGIMRPYVADVLAGTSWLDGQLYYDPRSKDPRLRSWALVRRLRQRRPDLALLFTNSLRTAALAWLGGARERIGFRLYGRGLLLTKKLDAPREPGRVLALPALDAYLELARVIGCQPDSPRLELATLPADEQAADAAWERLGLTQDRPVVVLNPGGAFGPSKLWPSDSFAALGRRLAEEDGLSVLVNCGPAEREIARAIVRGAGHARVVSLADDQLTLGLSKACIRRSQLLVTTDSGARFFAPAFGVPVVSLFGPTAASWSTIHWPGETCLEKKVPCGPCRKRVCPLEHHRCMRELSVDEVLAVARQKLLPKRREAA